jgi:hypothetical protein
VSTPTKQARETRRKSADLSLAASYYLKRMLNRITTLVSIIIFTLLAIFYAYPSTKQTVIMSLSSKLSITDVSLKGEKVLIRVDFNVPYVPPLSFVDLANGAVRTRSRTLLTLLYAFQFQLNMDDD